MATDHEGNQITVGYKGMVMLECTGLMSDGTIIWQGGYSGDTVTTRNGADTHKGQGNWPGVP
jgi:hypothetical protein